MGSGCYRRTRRADAAIDWPGSTSGNTLEDCENQNVRSKRRTADGSAAKKPYSPTLGVSGSSQRRGVRKTSSSLTTAVKEVIDESSELISILQGFVQELSRNIDELDADLRSSNVKEIKKSLEFKKACDELRRVQELAYDFIDKIEGLYHHGKSERQYKAITDGLNHNDKTPLASFIDTLECQLAHAGESFVEFDQACAKCKKSCCLAEEFCKTESVKVGSKANTRMRTGMVTSTGLVSLGVGAGAAAAAVATLGTFGIGALVVLGAVAIGGIASGTVTGYITYSSARELEDTSHKLKVMASHFQDVQNGAIEVNTKLNELKRKMNTLKCIIDDLKSHKHSVAVLDSLDRLKEHFNELYCTIRKCRNKMETNNT